MEQKAYCYEIKSTVNEYILLCDGRRVMGYASFERFKSYLPDTIRTKIRFDKSRIQTAITPVYNDSSNWIFSVNGQEKFYPTKGQATRMRDAYIQRLSLMPVTTIQATTI